MRTHRLSIALLTYSTKPRGGVVHTLALAEALAADGHQVSVWSLARGGDEAFFRPVAPSVRLNLVPFPDRDNESVGHRIMRSIQVLGAAFESSRYDIVHAQDCISANAVDRCIRTIHHLDTFSTPELIACHERAILGPRAHICVSRSVAEEVRLGWGITPTVIGNGIDAARFAAAASPAAHRERDRWAAELGEYVLSVGGIEPRKGTDDLMTAMAQVQAVRPGLRLVIGGGETLFDYRDYRARVEAIAVRLGVDYTVLGPVAHERVPALMAQSRVFAFPSRKEGFGLAAMEALATGVPVVVRDLPVLREVFGETVDYAADAQLLAAAILRAAGGRAGALAGDRGNGAISDRGGFSLAAQHSWSDVAARHVEFYRELLRADIGE